MPRRLWLAPMILSALGGSGVSVADDPAPKRPSRVVEGRLLDEQGKPPSEGRVMFGPQAPPLPFIEASTAILDAEGRFRVELADFPSEGGPIPAIGPLRYLALAPGSRPVAGKVAPGPGPERLEIRLVAEPWKATELLMLDQEGKPVGGVAVDLGIGTARPWFHLRGDAQGRCRITSPPGQFFVVSTRLEGYLPTTFGFRGTPDDPSTIKVPLRPPIRGRVVDPAGKPMADVRIGRSMGNDAFADDPQAASRIKIFPLQGTKEPAITGPDGRFELTPTLRLDGRSIDRSGEFRLWPQSLCFADEDFRRVAFVGVDFKAMKPLGDITLGPARRVRIAIEHEVTIPSGELSSWWELTCFVDPGRADSGLFVMDGQVIPKKPGADPAEPERIEAYWPPGKYRLKINSADPKAEQGMEESEVDLTVPPGDEPLDLAPIRLTASSRHRLVGQSAPEIDAKDLDTGMPVRLADLRGKVVVLDFWGHWCGPCVGSMPSLVDLHDRFKGKPVAILALHDGSIQSREEYDRKLSGVKAQLWDGQDLPFRVALDRPDPDRPEDRKPAGSGVTCKRYDIQYFPTTLLIDQAGKVVASVNAREPDRLEGLIRGLLADPPAR